MLEGHKSDAWDRANYIGYYSAAAYLPKSTEPMDIHPGYQSRWSKVRGTLKENKDRVRKLMNQLRGKPRTRERRKDNADG